MTSSAWHTIAFAAALLAGMSPSNPAMAALPPATSPAPAGDYAQFRKLAQPLHVLDLLKALQHNLARTASPMKELPSKWHVTFDAALARGIEANSDAVTDAIMTAAFVSFSHVEVERLRILGANPFLERFQMEKIKVLYDADPDMTATRQILATDPDFLSLSPDDRKLLGQLIKASEGSEMLRDVMAPIIHAAMVEADATLELPPLGPVGRR